jgi:putative DNA primase/helicase
MKSQMNLGPLFRLGSLYISQGYMVILMHRPMEGACTCGAASCTKIGKHPRFNDWPNKTIQDAEAFRQALKANPLSNIAIVPREDMIVIDVDEMKGGKQSLKNLECQFGKLPTCPTVLTGGGGLHRYYSAPILVRNSVGTVAPGIDVRTRGGCAIAPPSVHSSGDYYKWAPGLSLSDLRLPLLPDWMLDLLDRRKAQQSASKTPRSNNYSGFQQGARNDGMTRLAGMLIGKDIDLECVHSLLVGFNERFNEPPLDESEIKTIVSSIAEREIKKRRSRAKR